MKKRIIAFICVLALLLGTPIASVEAASATDTYQVGFGKVDITPEVDSKNPQLAMGGYGDQSSRRATAIMTPQFLKTQISKGYSELDKSLANSIPSNANENMYHLYASCIAITDAADTTVLLMTLDVINISTTQSQTMAQAIKDATGVPVENITITSTHTHSAPTVTSTDYEANNEWRDVTITNGLVQAAVAAMSNRGAATMWEGSVKATGTASIRHYYTSTTSEPMLDAEGKRHVEGSNFGSIYGSGKTSVKSADEDMNILMFKMEDSKQKDIVLCNYRVHPCRDSSSSVFDHESDTGYRAISSDYIGPMRDALEQAGYNFAYFQGSAGNVASKGGMSSYHYGTNLASYALSGLKNLTQVATGPIQTQRLSMSGNVYQPDPADVEPAKAVRALYDDLLDGDPAINDPELAEIFNSAVYYKKSIVNGSVKSTKTNVNATYSSNLNDDGKFDATEAHNIANRLAWSYGLGSRYHANNIVSNAGKTGTKKIQLNAISLGKDIAIVTDPNEIFDDLTQDLVSYYGKRTFVFGYTNGAQGYLPNDDAFYYNATLRPDGTMAYGGSYETHVTDFAMGTGAKVATTLKAMLDKMVDIEACACMGAHTDEEDCNVITWEPWTSTTSLPSIGNYYLTDNVTVSAPTQIQGTLNLDLRGYAVTGSNNSGIFTASSQDHLVITDSYKGGQLGASGISICAYPESTLTVYGGNIGGTVKVEDAKVTLAGDPSINLNLSATTEPVDCTLLKPEANVYVIAPALACFATISDASQVAAFSLANDYSVRTEGNKLYISTKQNHCICNGTLSGLYGHVCEQLTWQPWTKTDALPTTTGNYYLTSNVYLAGEQTIEAGATVRLDLNSKTIYAGQVLNSNSERVAVDNPTRAYYVPTGSTLEITSSTGSGTIDGSVTKPAATDRGACGGVIYADEGSILRLYNGSIKGYRNNTYATAYRGGCVYAMGEFTMYGGSITNGAVKNVAGTASRGGNVYAKNFTMYGGTISNGLGTGINVYIDNGFTAHIGGNAYVNAGIVLRAEGSLTLSGAPHIPTWVYSSGSTTGIYYYDGAPIDATQLDAQAMAQPAPNGDASRWISVKMNDTSSTAPFASVASPAQAGLFKSHLTNYSIRCDADGKLYLYNNTDTRYGCVCGGKLTSLDAHTCDTTMQWQPWTETTSLPTEGNYYLTANVAVSAATVVTSELNLDLNGMTITATGNQRVLDAPDGTTLRITDSGETGAIDASAVTFQYEYTYANLNDTAYYGGVIRTGIATFQLYGGTLIAASNVARGGILYTAGTSTSTSKKAIATIYCGTLIGSEAVFGGSIYTVYTNFKMYGGTVTGGTAGRGGNYYHSTGTTSYIYGGTFENGNAHQYDYFNEDPTTKEYTVATKSGALGGNIYVVSSSTMYFKDGLVTDGTTTKSNGNGGNIAVGGTLYIDGGKITRGAASNMGDNLYVSKTLYVRGGEICNPGGSERRNIALWAASAHAIISGGSIYGGDYGVYNGSSGGKTTLKNDPHITGSSYGIYINSSYTYDATTDTYTENMASGTTSKSAQLVVDKSYTGYVDVYWASDTFKALGIGNGQEIGHTTAKNPFTGTVICANLKAPLLNSANGKLIVATTAIMDGDGTVSNYATFADALAAYELDDTSVDQQYLQLLTNQSDVEITESVHLDLGGKNITVASVAENCSIYAMDSATNQYTRYTLDGTDLCGKLTFADSAAASALVKDVVIHLTKNGTAGTRKYLALPEDGSYTFHRYYLSLNEAGLRPADAGIFYNAEFYGDEAIAAAVTAYGVEVSAKETFDANSTARSNYQKDLGAFQAGLVGNYGYRTVLVNILSKNGAGKVTDYSNRTVYGRAYITVGDTTLYCSDVGSTTLRSILRKADVSYGKGALSDAQVKALDDMYKTYSDVIDGWNILNHIGHIDVSIDDLFQKNPKDDDELNILLIGHSFSFYWVEELYGLLAENSGYDPEKITITNVYYSGCPLKNHWTWLETGEANYNIAVTNHTGRSYDKTKFEDLNAVITGSRAMNWDFISLQQSPGAFYSGEEVGDLDYARQTLEPYLGNLVNYLRGYYPKAEYMWHQFWASEVGHKSSSGIVTVENLAERAAFHNASVAIGSEVSQVYDMTIVPTGIAWELVRDNSLFTTSRSDSFDKFTLCTRIYNGKLYDDLYHDGDIGGGQYLNACVWYEIITGKSVIGNAYKPTYILDGTDYSLSNEQIRTLQSAAHTAVAAYTTVK